MYLVKEDYRTKVKDNNLTAIVESDDSIRTEEELASQSEIESYLRHRYDTAKIFVDVLSWDRTTAFKIGDLIFLNSTAYNDATAYIADDLVSFTGDVYINILGSTGVDPTNAANWTKIGANLSFYSAITDNTNILPNVSNDWTLGDTRDQLIKRVYIDLVMYHITSRIKPRNISEIIGQRRDEAIEWLKMVARGDISTSLPTLQDSDGNEEGLTLRYGTTGSTNLY